MTRIVTVTDTPEGADVLVEDLYVADWPELLIVAEWMLEHGWTEPLDSAPRAGVRPPSEGLDVERLRAAATRVIEATEAHRDAVNGRGHPDEPHDRAIHMEPCTSIPDAHIYSTSSDCAACGGAEYGTEDEMHGAIGDLRAACGYERRPWEYHRPDARLESEK